MNNDISNNNLITFALNYNNNGILYTINILVPYFVFIINNNNKYFIDSISYDYEVNSIKNNLISPYVVINYILVMSMRLK